jgi:hypothetical protein
MGHLRIESPGQLVFVLVVAAILAVGCYYLQRPK